MIGLFFCTISNESCSASGGKQWNAVWNAIFHVVTIHVFSLTDSSRSVTGSYRTNPKRTKMKWAYASELIFI